MNIAILVSGRGSNMKAVLGAVRRGSIRGAEVKLVVSNRAEVPALAIATSYGVPAMVLDSSRFGRDRREYDRQLQRILEEHGVVPHDGLVLLAGFDRILSREFVEHYRDRVMNIHPSLLPSFPGLQAQRKALEHGVKVSGCTVHFVVPEVDAGPIILQAAVPVMENDEAETLATRILRQEHRIYPQAVRLFVQGKLRIASRTVRIAE